MGMPSARARAMPSSLGVLAEDAELRLGVLILADRRDAGVQRRSRASNHLTAITYTQHTRRMVRTSTEIALASGILAGQMALSGLILVFHGFVLSRYLELKDSPNPPRQATAKLHSLLFVTAFAAGMVLIAAIVPAVWFTQSIDVWTLYAVFLLSILLLLIILGQSIRVFR